MKNMNSWSSRDLGLARKGWEQGVWWAEGCQGEAERNALARGWVRWRLRLGGAGCMGRPGCGHSFFSVHGGLASWAARQEVAITSSYNEGAKTCSPLQEEGVRERELLVTLMWMLREVRILPRPTYLLRTGLNVRKWWQWETSDVY